MDVILQVQRGSKKTRSIRLRSEETIVGRREGCDLRIPSSAVSRRHCRLSFRNDYLTVEDLDSANGTFVNGVPVTGQQVVRPGDSLEIGPVTFLVKYQLTQAAIDRLLEEGGAAEQEGLVEIDDLEEVADIEEVEEPTKETGRKDKKKRTERKKTTHREAKKPARKKPEPEPDDVVPLAFDAESSLKLPPEEDLRDILSRLDEDS